MNANPSQPPRSSAPNSSGGAAILLMGFLILLVSCALILAVRIHARLDGMTKAIEELAAATKRNTEAVELALGTGRVPPRRPGQREDASDTPSNLSSKPLSTAKDRSPIPQPGEAITKPLPAVKIGELEPAKPIAAEPAAGEIVPWDKAHLHMGRTITVEGTIVNTKRQETICFLNFSEEGNTSPFYMVVFKGQFDDYGGAPEKFFLNKKVRVTGLVEEHRGRTQIKINKKEQVLSVE